MSAKDLLQTRIIEPIKKQCPESVSMDAYLQLVFNIHRRGISRYRTLEDVVIPGLYCVNGCIPTQGLGDQWRKIGPRKHILVRHDDDQPNLYHVETHSHVFALTKQDWTKFRTQLALASDNVEV